MLYKKKSNAGKKIAIGAALAGVGGYLAGILTAPKSGKETRSDIARKAGEVKAGSLDQLERTHKELAATLKEAQGKTMALGSQARDEFNEAVIRAKDAQNKTAAVIKAVKKGGADDPELNKAVKQGKQAIKNLGKFLRG